MDDIITKLAKFLSKQFWFRCFMAGLIFAIIIEIIDWLIVSVLGSPDTYPMWEVVILFPFACILLGFIVIKVGKWAVSK